MGKSVDSYATIGAYMDVVKADADWARLVEAAEGGGFYLSDAAMVGKDEQGVFDILERRAHHGWGKGMLAGAIVGIVSPASLVGGALAGTIGGAAVARANRSLDRGDLRDLGKALDAGSIVIVAITDEASVSTLKGSVFTNAVETYTANGKLDWDRESLEKEFGPRAGANI